MVDPPDRVVHRLLVAGIVAPLHAFPEQREHFAIEIGPVEDLPKEIDPFTAVVQGPLNGNVGLLPLLDAANHTRHPFQARLAPGNEHFADVGDEEIVAGVVGVVFPVGRMQEDGAIPILPDLPDGKPPLFMAGQEDSPHSRPLLNRHKMSNQAVIAVEPQFFEAARAALAEMPFVRPIHRAVETGSVEGIGQVDESNRRAAPVCVSGGNLDHSFFHVAEGCSCGGDSMPASQAAVITAAIVSTAASDRSG